jgi:pyridoxamine 5'-phosphate oxidase
MKPRVKAGGPRDPMELFRQWFAEARRAGMPQPQTMALATADRAGRTSVRFVLLKDCDGDGMVFYTNARSRKGRELDENPRASIAFWWDRIGKQVRAEGRVVQVSDAQADAYWKTRPRLSRLAARVSRQSEPIASRERLSAKMTALTRRLSGREIARPRHWTGFRLIADRIEFWTMRAHRLHERELFVRSGRGWKRMLLQP